MSSRRHIGGSYRMAYADLDQPPAGRSGSPPFPPSSASRRKKLNSPSSVSNSHRSPVWMCSISLCQSTGILAGSVLSSRQRRMRNDAYWIDGDIDAPAGRARPRFLRLRQSSLWPGDSSGRACVQDWRRRTRRPDGRVRIRARGVIVMSRVTASDEPRERHRSNVMSSLAFKSMCSRFLSGHSQEIADPTPSSKLYQIEMMASRAPAFC